MTVSSSHVEAVCWQDSFDMGHLHPCQRCRLYLWPWASLAEDSVLQFLHLGGILLGGSCSGPLFQVLFCTIVAHAYPFPLPPQCRQCALLGGYSRSQTAQTIISPRLRVGYVPILLAQGRNTMRNGLPATWISPHHHRALILLNCETFPASSLAIIMILSTLERTCLCTCSCWGGICICQDFAWNLPGFCAVLHPHSTQCAHHGNSILCPSFRLLVKPLLVKPPLVVTSPCALGGNSPPPLHFESMVPPSYSWILVRACVLWSSPSTSHHFSSHPSNPFYDRLSFLTIPLFYFWYFFNI